jgi:glucokinase
MTRLLADIGGTNARFALMEPGGEARDIRHLRCQDFPGPAEAAKAYLKDCPGGTRVDSGAFGIAAPVTGDRVTIVNNHWAFSVDETRKALGLQRLAAVNDFTVQALALPHLKPGDLRAFNDVPAAKDAAMAVIGPGTGLGVSGLLPGPRGWTPISGEGGHSSMAARTKREAAVIAAIESRFSHCSIERAVSGPGLVNIHAALRSLEGLPEESIDPQRVTASALDGSCAQCDEALDLMIDFLATSAANLALTLGARGGVFLAGGILPRLPHDRVAPRFMARFLDMGRYRGFLGAIPVHLVIHPDPAFLGLAALAEQESPS